MSPSSHVVTRPHVVPCVHGSPSSHGVPCASGADAHAPVALTQYAGPRHVCGGHTIGVPTHDGCPTPSPEQYVSLMHLLVDTQAVPFGAAVCVQPPRKSLHATGTPHVAGVGGVGSVAHVPLPRHMPSPWHAVANEQCVPLGAGGAGPARVSLPRSDA